MSEHDPKPVASLDEIRAILRELPAASLEAATAALTRDRQLAKPAGALGRLEELAEWMAAWQGRHPPRLRRPRTALFAANHGVAARGVSAFPAGATAQMVQNSVNGGAAVNQLCRAADAELRVYEMALEHPTRDFTEAPAMDEEECARAIAYGMMAVEQGIDLLALGDLGIGNTSSAAAVCLALFGGEAADWVGPGSGVAGEALARKVEAVAAGVARHRAAMTDPFLVLACVGGYELAAIAGAVIAARMGRVPVLLDGFACTAAAAVLFACDPRSLDHCQAAQRSAEPGHARLLERIGKRPLLDLGINLGEGAAATLCIPILRAAVEAHAGMATFAEAGMSGRL